MPGHREEYIAIEVLAYDERLVLRWVAYHRTFRRSLKTTTTTCWDAASLVMYIMFSRCTWLNVTVIVGALLFRSIIIWKLSGIPIQSNPISLLSGTWPIESNTQTHNHAHTHTHTQWNTYKQHRKKHQKKEEEKEKVANSTMKYHDIAAKACKCTTKEFRHENQDLLKTYWQLCITVLKLVYDPCFLVKIEGV